MGRRDAVQVTLEVIAEMRRLEPRLIVSYEPGWESRGNGTSANYDFATVHHTASATSLAKPFPTQNLLRVGRSDLPGPLCNEAGPACTVDAPRIHVMAANPANHAGASRASGPVPALSLFNPRTRGLEIDYAGTVPMLAGQLYVAQLWAKANAKVLAGGNVEYVRAHAETSVTGKWDPGYANGKTIDMAAFRRGAAALNPATPPPLEDDDVKLDEVLWFRYRDEKDPRGYGESKVTVGELFVDMYTQMFWGHGRNTAWGPGVATQLLEVRKELAEAAPATVDAAAVAAALAKDSALVDALAERIAARIATQS